VELVVHVHALGLHGPAVDLGEQGALGKVRGADDDRPVPGTLPVLAAVLLVGVAGTARAQHEYREGQAGHGEPVAHVVGPNTRGNRVGPPTVRRRMIAVRGRPGVGSDRRTAGW